MAITPSKGGRDGLQRVASRSKSYVDLTVESDAEESEGEVLPLRPSQKDNKPTKRKRVSLSHREQLRAKF